MKSIYEVQSYYSGWHTDRFFSSRKKAEKYIQLCEKEFQNTKQIGRQCFQIVKREIL